MENKKRTSREARLVVGILGLEPRMTGPESVVLPLHHIPMLVLHCKVTTFFAFGKRMANFFALNLHSGLCVSANKKCRQCYYACNEVSCKTMYLVMVAPQKGVVNA